MNRSHILRFCAAALFTITILLRTVASEPLDELKTKKNEPPATHTVKRGVLKSKGQLDAVLESTDMSPIKIVPKSWSDLTVVEAVAHGAKVTKGDILVRLETEKLKDQIEDLENERPGAKVAFELATAELENLEQTTPLKLEAAKRSFRNADEDYSYFESTGRPQREKSAKFNLKGSEQRLENAMEELKQLEKMYKADDITEETEEIVLKRQKYSVEAAQFYLESTKLSTGRDLEIFILREYENLKNTRRDQELALTLAEQNLPKNLSKKRLDYDKLKRDQKKGEKKLADYKNDLELLTVRSPSDGMVYYGACENGKWTSGGMVAKKLIPGGKLSANEVFITVVNPDKLVLKTTVQESDLSNFKIGQKGNASPVAAPDKKLPVKLEELGIIPLAGGGFEARLSVKKDKNVRIFPGMNCKVSFTEGTGEEMLLVPKEAVQTDGDEKYVLLAKRIGEPEKQIIKTGKSDDKMIQVLEGLSEGDKVVLKSSEKPSASKSEKPASGKESTKKE
jgi:HlyD family secretion protein